MDCTRWTIFALTLFGAAVTIYGFAAVWVNARSEYRDAQARIDKLGELDALEKADSAAVNDEHQANMPDEHGALLAYQEAHRERQVARHAAREARYAEFDLVRVTYDNLAYIAAFESRRLLGLVLKSTGRDMLIAASGLVISTAASAWSLFLT